MYYVYLYLLTNLSCLVSLEMGRDRIGQKTLQEKKILHLFSKCNFYFFNSLHIVAIKMRQCEKTRASEQERAKTRLF